MTAAIFVIVSGPPASGKSTLAPAVARELSLPLIAKDTIKDALMSVFPVPDVETSRQVGQGAVAAMLAVAAESPIGAVIECNFYRSVVVDALRRLPGRVMRCSVDVTGPLPLPGMRRELECVTRDTLTASGPAMSSGTTKSLDRWPAGGQCSRSVQSDQSLWAKSSPSSVLPS